MAERITQLGGTARGTVQAVEAETKLAAYPLDTYAVADHLAALIDRYKRLRQCRSQEHRRPTDDAGDAGTADLFTEVSRGVDKQLWFLEAHVQEPTGQMRDGDGAGKK